MSFKDIEDKLNDYEFELFNEKKHSIEEIKEIEVLYNINLPDDYKQFLLKYGGSMIVDDYIYESIEQDSWSNDRFQAVEFFYGLEETDLDLYLKDKINLYNERFPSELIAIASSPFGNEICLVVKGKDIGKVYFWDHEYRNSKGDFYLIAETFTDFVLRFRKNN
ncbi:SMI1/KNR4 family protein [Metabacillus idriensis]|uniref:SMI1/KNR4 family protein n=1 Tax=Metabacillus idriensis TaxID=324768 RepID=UPI00174B26B5|nr:SMI1/KNR4 family protein [Metabacillus idriensis]